MSAVEARIALAVLGDIKLAYTSNEEIEEGTEPQVELHIPVGIPVPVGPSQAIGAPLGVLTLTMSKEEASELGAETVKVTEAMPDPKPKSEILFASNIAEVREQADQIQRFTQGA